MPSRRSLQIRLVAPKDIIRCPFSFFRQPLHDFKDEVKEESFIICRIYADKYAIKMIW